jgi:predicted PhzF superfamily epimerase YddE/YHI9
MTIEQFRCFGRDRDSGNLALVVRGFPADALERQQFASARRAPACVFVDAGPTLDFYYPHTRSPLCLHASLAAAYVLAAAGPVTVHTAQGLPLLLSRDGDACFATVTPQEVDTTAPDRATVRALLASPGLVPTSAPVVASVGSPKLLVEMPNEAELQALRPDLPAIVQWGRAHGVNGIYAWTRRADGSLAGRNFNHLDPALEDSATGVAAGALTTLLRRGLRVHQGEATGNPCLLLTRWDGATVQVGGQVSTLP